MEVTRSEPIISVLTPSYGYGRFIQDAILSVGKQSFVRTEHIVQDGRSVDETISVLESSGESVNWRSESDLGQSDALNKALDRAKGEWIGWLNADEFYFPGALSVLLTHAIRSSADVVYGDAIFVDVNGALMRLLPQHRFSKSVLRWYGPFISSCSVLFRREILGEAPWDVQCRRIMDYDLYLRLSEEGRRFQHVPIPVGAFRVHDERVTAQPKEHFIDERRGVQLRYGLKGRPERELSLGRAAHGAMKFRDGAYRRQRGASRLGALDLRWFRGPHQEQAVRTLIHACYSDSEMQ